MVGSSIILAFALVFTTSTQALSHRIWHDHDSMSGESCGSDSHRMRGICVRDRNGDPYWRPCDQTLILGPDSCDYATLKKKPYASATSKWEKWRCCWQGPFACHTY